jgi:hypothetical protein
MSPRKQCSAFTRMVSQMRDDSASERKVMLVDLQAVLLGPQRDAT